MRLHCAECDNTGCVSAMLIARVVCNKGQLCEQEELAAVYCTYGCRPQVPGVRPASPAWEVSAAGLQSLLHKSCLGLLVVDNVALLSLHELSVCAAEALRTL